eukprot:TRINITY_DN32042_c0_g1_i1.p1 TRINITY_DN32042_c0_g1~~TRINITY_DN32042_c0_g1_i1.p1  ORF type:complete len:597 (+),score=241.30 TRINITY_DN32042_c0_g1_i1:56-1846(+)
MIDEIVILHKGGLVLWTHQFTPVRGNPVNQLIKTVLLEDRFGDECFTFDQYKLEWVLDNERELIVVVVYQQLLALGYVGSLLAEVRQAFVAQHQGMLEGRRWMDNYGAFCAATAKFTPVFENLLKTVEEAAEELRKETRRGASRAQASPSPSRGGDESSSPVAHAEPEGGSDSASAPASPTSPSATGERVLKGKAAMIARMKQRKEGGASSSSKKAAAAAPKAPPKKQMRAKWNDDGTPGVEGAGFEDLSADANAPRPVIEQTEDPEANPSDLDATWAGLEKPEKSRSRFANFLRERFGTNRAIDGQDLDTILPELRETMTSKNVAQDIAESLIASTKADLTGKTIPNFTSLSQAIKDSLQASLLRILTPKKDINILRDVAKAKELGRPYTIAFCGVNGVGKSTNLSKVAYWLKGNGQRVMLAACDTFRSGAVEQLKVHSGRIGVPVHDQGYAKDAADVAKNAIIRAKKEGYDVCLIDTAGRMQDNEPLMRSLAKLMHTNKPDLVLFVGEALVGNDGVDQLKKFNQSLRDHTPPGHPVRGIDGIVLTKFDTIDDKVGAAISMVYQSGQPIVFVGVGQSYQDLRALNPKVVVQALIG